MRCPEAFEMIAPSELTADFAIRLSTVRGSSAPALLGAPDFAHAFRTSDALDNISSP